MRVFVLMHRLLCADNATGARTSRTREQIRILSHSRLDDGNYACNIHLVARKDNEQNRNIFYMYLIFIFYYLS